MESFDERHLMDVAYTLQIGREVMEERLALTADSIEKLKKKLTAFLAGEENNEVFHGTAQAGKAVLSTISSDDEMKVIIGNWLTKGKYEKLLELWVKGLEIDWNMLYRDGTPRRISLPTYPFNRQKCWFSDVGKEVEQPDVTLNSKQTSNQKQPSSSLNGCMYLPVWEEAQVVPSERPPDQQVVIVYEKSAATLKEAIIDYYHMGITRPHIVQICLGDITRQHASDQWECDIYDESAFHHCLADCGSIDRLFFLAEHADKEGRLEPQKK